MLHSAGRSTLVVVDAQERLLPAIRGAEAAVARVGLLVEAARVLGVPVVATEQYPQGLGTTAPPLADAIPPAERFAKTAFSAAAEPGFLDRLGGRPDAVVCGFEAHVCVLQTALGLLAAGLRVSVVADACGSRAQSDAERAFDRLARAGVVVATAEMVVFEWLGRAGTPEFRHLLRHLK